MKPLSIFKTSLLLAGSCFLFSCQKEITRPSEFTIQSAIAYKEGKTYALKGNFDFHYTIIPDLNAGWTLGQIYNLWVPGGAEGEMTHMGRVKAFFNQYNYLLFTQDAVLVKSNDAPLLGFNQIFKDSLATLADAIGNIQDTVSIVFFDQQGNSIMAKQDGLGLTYSAADPSWTWITFNCKYNILGGTGKYKDAHGWFVLNGWFDPKVEPLGEAFSYQSNAGWVVSDGELKF